MTDDHKVVNRRRSVNNIHLQYSIYTTCIQLVQQSAVLADTDIRLIVKTQPVSVRNVSNCYTLEVVGRGSEITSGQAIEFANVLRVNMPLGW